MAYNWQRHVKPPKPDSSFIPFVVNTNTNTIFRFDNNPHYKSSQACKASGETQTKEQKRKRQYVKVRADGNLDYNKTAPSQRVSKWIKQDYVIPCKTYNQALYHQAILRMDKSTEDTKEQWRKIAEDIQDKYPEELI